MDIEIEVASYFDMRRHLIVPNVSWMIGHECDVLILSPAGVATEVEIKISLADLKIDKKKHHAHKSPLIHKLYFAIPDYMEKDIEHIPEHAGILIVTPQKKRSWRNPSVRCIREPKMNKDKKGKILPKWSPEKRLELLRLSTMRIWSLKEKLNKQLKEKIKCKSESSVKAVAEHI